VPWALWRLLGLHFKATLRRMRRGMATPRGIVFALLGLLAMGAWAFRVIVYVHVGRHTSADVVRTIAPFAILLFCLGNLLTSFGDHAVAFTAAEVDFLFPGPFSRRSLLGYKILKTCLGTLITTAVFTVMLRAYCNSWLACAVGVWLTIQFMQLFAMAVMLLGQTVGERAYSAGKRWALIAAAALLAIAAAPLAAKGFHGGELATARHLQGTLAGRIVLAPFDVFTRAITAASLYPELLTWGTLGLLIDLLMLSLVMGLDANYLETSATVSQRRYERISRLKRGAAGTGGSAALARWRIAPLPWLGGAGPLAWRQLTGALRGSRRLVILVAIVGIVCCSVFVHNRGGQSSVLEPLIGVAVWINLFFVSMLRFDFHDDLDRLDFLRSMPIGAAAVAAGEIVAPVVVLSLLQALLLIAAWMAVPESRLYLPIVAAFALPVNVLLVGIENLLFLLFPLRQAGLIAGDMQLFGRQMVIFMCKLLLLIAAVGAASIFGAVAYLVAGKSWAAFGVAGWMMLAIASAATIYFIAMVYTRFDPSVDTPA